MGAFSFKKKKRLKLHKRAELAAKPEGYRVPWSDTKSPLKIRFDDHDERRNGMKFARLQMDDGEIRPVIIQEGFWRGLTGDAPQVVVDDLAAKWGDELPHDEIRKEIQKHLEAHHKCKVILPPAETDDRVVTVEMIPTSWTGMLVLDLYVRANKIKMWLDAEADLCLSGYDLFARGVLDEDCMFNREPLQPSPEDRQEFADIFDLLEEGNATKEANKQAQRLLMFTYEGYLNECVREGFTHPNPDFKGHLENNLRAVRTWRAERMIELGNLPEGTTVAIVNPETGEVEHLMGPEAPLTGEFLEKNLKEIEKEMDAASKREVA
jgi:hypothetical protein